MKIVMYCLPLPPSSFFVLIYENTVVVCSVGDFLKKKFSRPSFLTLCTALDDHCTLLLKNLGTGSSKYVNVLPQLRRYHTECFSDPTVSCNN